MIFFLDETAVISRRVFGVLTTILIVLTVASAVLLTVQALLAALGDVRGAKVVLWIGLACLILLAIDVLLLVGALGVAAMQSSDNSHIDS